MSTSKTYQQSLADAGSETRPPMLERGSYIPWASRFKRFLNRKRENRKWLLKALEDGPYVFRNITPTGSTIPRLQEVEDLQGDDLLYYDAEMELMNMILLSIPNEIYNSVDSCKTAKEMWARVERLMRGTIQNQVDRETRFTNEFDQFVAEPGESLVSVYNRFAQLMNDLERNNMKFPTVSVNTKFLNSLQPEWLKYVTQVRLAKQLTVDSFDDLFDYLSQFEKLVNASRAKKLEKSHDPLALVAHTGSSSRNTSSYYVTHPSSVVDYDEEYEQDDVHNHSEDPLASAMLLLAKAITQNFSNPTNNRLRASSNTKNQAVVQGDRPRVRDSKYFMEQMLLAKQDEAWRSKFLLMSRMIFSLLMLQGWKKLKNLNLFQRDIKEMKDAFEQNDVYLDEIESLLLMSSEKTYAYGAIRAENQNLLDTISELTARMKNGENGMNATSSVKRPKSGDSHVKTSVLDVSKNEAKKEAIDNVNWDVLIAERSKAKTLLCISCMQSVLIPCHDKCVAKHKLNVHSNARRTFSVNSRIPKSSKTTFVAPKTSKVASKARDKVSSAFKKKESNMRDKPLSPFMLNKIQTSRLRQKWFESQPNVMWTPVNTKPHAHTNPLNTKPLVSVKRWIVKLPMGSMCFISCVAVVQIVLYVVDSGCSKHMTGLGHNLFSVGQFCDGDLEVDFCSNTCYVRNLEGDDLLTGGRDSNLYTISISDMAASSPICLMSKATSTKSWLWHRRLSHLNFGTINDLTKLDLVDGLPKFKYGKDHLCSACERGKSKKASHPPKLIPSDYSKLELLHMDLCGPMRVASVNGKKYILVIVDDFSRFTWVYFLRSKDETPEIIKKFIAQAQLNYKAKVCKIRTDNGTEFKNATLKAHYEKLGIMQQFSIARTPQQNGAEAVATTCFTQNWSIINTRHNKTPYELLRGRKPNVEYFHMFGSLCYPTNDRDDLGKMKPKADIGVFIGYSETSRGFRIYNRRTKRIMETIHVKFDELTAMASEHDCLEPDLQQFNNLNSSADLMNTPSKVDLDNLFGPMFEDYFEQKSSDFSINSAAQSTHDQENSPSTSSIIIDTHEAPSVVTTSDEQTSPISLQVSDEFNQEDYADFDGNTQFVPYDSLNHEEIESSTMNLKPSNVQNFHQVLPSTYICTKDHPLDQVIGDPSIPVMTRQRLHTDS
ncbi:retrovirus-related pol polyprotein from transposon TNT 1-94 [Tanacetum coccineum]|uniref:Retrovirus-related pol polyprotein from transposon TNT 1-94 n=1 Tax=Tanacetum coccineum TaxID=301880 RepID=A0ABQ5DRH7_9ASTR